VVASEVRNLAQRSATAAKEIKVLIDNSVGEIETGSRLVEQAGTTTRDVVDAIQRVTNLMGEISAASLEQTAGIDQVNRAISQMDQVTQQNAALVEEAAAASESLQEQAEKLAPVVGQFKLPGQRLAVPALSSAGARPHQASVASISYG
jgi:methyl-accepting chemotaxis protein